MKISLADHNKILALRLEGQTATKIAQAFEVSHTSILNVLKKPEFKAVIQEKENSIIQAIASLTADGFTQAEIAAKLGMTAGKVVLRQKKHQIEIPSHRKDLTGQMFGSWKVLEYAGAQIQGRSTNYSWRCQCTEPGCETIKVIQVSNLSQGKTTKCHLHHNFKRPARPVKCLGTGKVYRSLSFAAQSYGVQTQEILEAAKSGTKCCDLLWEFVGEEVAT